MVFPILIGICRAVGLVRETDLIRRGVKGRQAVGREFPWFFMAAVACVGQNY